MPPVLTQALLLLSYVIVQLCQRMHKLAEDKKKQDLLCVMFEHHVGAVRSVCAPCFSSPSPNLKITSEILQGAFLTASVVTKYDCIRHGNGVHLVKNLASLDTYRSMCSALILTINACCKLNKTQKLFPVILFSDHPDSFHLERHSKESMKTLSRVTV